MVLVEQQYPAVPLAFLFFPLPAHALYVGKDGSLITPQSLCVQQSLHSSSVAEGRDIRISGESKPARGGLKLLKCSSHTFGEKIRRMTKGGAAEREILENFPGIRNGKRKEIWL